MTLFSCSGVKFLVDGERFYAGSSIHINDKEHTQNLKSIRNDINEVLKPKPNEKVLGMRPAVWLHGALGETKKEKGIKSFFKRSLAKAPVLYHEDIAQNSAQLIRNRLFNRGHFNNSVQVSFDKMQHEVSITYEISIGRPFLYGKINTLEDSTVIGREIQSVSDASLIKLGDPYNLSLLKKERERINQHLKDKGFYYFNPQFVLFEVDSTYGDHQIELSLLLKENLPALSFKSYTIDSVTVYPNYTLEKDSIIQLEQPKMLNNVNYKDPSNKFRPAIFEPLISLRKGQRYQLSDHQLTLKRLSELNAFKFVNVRIQNVDSSAATLKTQIYLTPQSSKSIQFDFEGSSKSNNFVGPSMSLDYKNRNRWKGAEVLGTTFNGGFETQISGRQKGLNSYETGFNLSVTIPRLLSPLRFNISPDSEIPKTTINLGNSFLRRAGFYSISRSTINFGYSWNKSKKVFHRLNIADLNYVFLNNTTDEFDELLTKNPALQQSFQNQLIMGATYSLTISNQVQSNDEDYLYFNTHLDLSGNLAGLFSKKDAEDTEQKKLLGVPFAQYARISFDFRYFWNFNQNRSLVTRTILGIGIPYNNSRQLPFIKQFFIGGSNSVRAFPPRGVGPGSFQPEGNTPLFVDQSGDIKLETNLEYRSRIYGVFHGALFLDAGNVWLLNSDIDRPGGSFNMENLGKDIAIGTGVGLRLDFTYFVLRFDWAFPLKLPGSDDSNGWVIDDIDFSSKPWRQNNLTLNIAVGYPF